MIAHYPQPFHERFPSIERPPRFTRIREGKYTFEIGGDVWEIEATSIAAALRQAPQLQKLKREGVI